MSSLVMAETLRRTKGVLAPLGEKLPQLEALYIDFHRYPELSGQEARTAAQAERLLRAAGYDVMTGLGGRGVAGILENGDGPLVLLRAEMDGLPVEERTGLPYASRQTGRLDKGANGDAVPIAHACGHDAHLTCLIGTASLLREAKQAWRGTLMVVAQPAEELGTGAKAMLQDGLYTRLGKPDIALAQHVVPIPAGMIAHKEGPVMAASAVLNVTIFGTSGHAAVPHAAIDPVVIAAHVIARLQAIVSREVDPTAVAVVSVGTVHAGTAANVIPDRAELGISVRSYDDSVQGRLIEAVARVVRAEAAASGARRDPEIAVAGDVPVNSNTPFHSRRVRDVHNAFFGPERVIDAPPLTASEDFPYFAAAGSAFYGGAAVPSVYWLIGATAPQAWHAAAGDTATSKLANLPVNHSPLFAPDPVPTLRTGVEALTSAALAFLPAPPHRNGPVSTARDPSAERSPGWPEKGPS